MEWQWRGRAGKRGSCLGYHLGAGGPRWTRREWVGGRKRAARAHDGGPEAVELRIVEKVQILALRVDKSKACGICT